MAMSKAVRDALPEQIWPVEGHARKVMHRVQVQSVPVKKWVNLIS